MRIIQCFFILTLLLSVFLLELPLHPLKNFKNSNKEASSSHSYAALSISITASYGSSLSNSKLTRSSCVGLFEKSSTKNNVSRQIMEGYSSKLSSYFGTHAKGYALILTTMVATASLTTYLNGQLSTNYQFLSYFINQISTLGIIVIGAPIWERVSSHIRNKAFLLGKPDEAFKTLNSEELETLWSRTQENYSLNSQMSRNLISNALINIQTTLYESQKALKEENLNFASAQIAMIAMRLRILFSEISPDDQNLALAFKGVFFEESEISLKDQSELYQSILNHLKTMDEDFNKPSIKGYYESLLKNWIEL